VYASLNPSRRMSRQNDFLLLPCEKEDFLTISSKGYFCFPPTDPTESDDPVSLDSFFCNAIGDEGVDQPSAVPFYQSLDCQPLYAADDEAEVESMYLDLWDS